MRLCCLRRLRSFSSSSAMVEHYLETAKRSRGTRVYGGYTYSQSDA